ncbi:competence/damage-inducible protein A [Mangrovimonas aestuarii]|uniref:competence/damage-inducible protein A n=1 Tax=Mangrovimonas aestuarii TaxID=3018443 RepID=UPI002378E3D0|nr:competence/damage-inducible protein A [Mangrovimonas aestuarii]
MQAEIITIGDEILIGQIVDTNSAYISKELNKIGVSVYQITSVQDDREHILKALKEAEDNADIVVVTGGLGPTKDDITKHTFAEYFEDNLVLDESVLKHVEELFAKYLSTPISNLNRDQALVPSKATVLPNDHGTAPGMWFNKGEKVFVSLPGVPYEMKALMKKEVMPRLKATYNFPSILHKTLITYGLGESALAERLEQWEDSLPNHIKLAYLPNLGKVRLRLTAKGQYAEGLKKDVDAQIERVMSLIEDIFIGFEDDVESIEELIGRLLVSSGKTLATAESCTGGTIAQKITSHPGASEYFKGSVVSYATDIKTKVLGVPPELIKKHTVVSSEVARAMAQGVLNLYNVDYALATTGNAGPEKGESDADVGTVFIALASKNGVFAKEFHFGNHRTKVINKSVNKAFELLKVEILKK